MFDRGRKELAVVPLHLFYTNLKEIFTQLSTFTKQIYKIQWTHLHPHLTM
jgi:hypothetical protein